MTTRYRRPDPSIERTSRCAPPPCGCPTGSARSSAPDPAGPDVAAVRPVRDEVGRRVRALLDELGVAAR